AGLMWIRDLPFVHPHPATKPALLQSLQRLRAIRVAVSARQAHGKSLEGGSAIDGPSHRSSLRRVVFAQSKISAVMLNCTAASSGISEIPSARRACVPRSPKSLLISSEAPIKHLWLSAEPGRG